MDNIGQTLKAAREKKGYTLDDLQQITKIQKRYLIAIEENNFEALPGQFYVRAFVRQYANTVGLDGDAVVAQLTKGSVTDNAGGAAGQSLSRRRQNGPAPATKPGMLERLKQQLPLITIIGVVVLIIGGVVYASVQNRRATQHERQIAQTSRKVTVNNNVHHHHSSAVTSSTNSKISSATVASSSTNSTMTSRSSSAQSSKAKHHKKQSFKLTRKSGKTFVYKMKNNDGNNVIQLTGKADESWCSVAVNGETLWQGTLMAGMSRQIRIPAAATNVQISLGNSKGTLIKFNGRKFNFLKANHKLTVRSIVINMGTVPAQATGTVTNGTPQTVNRDY